MMGLSVSKGHIPGYTVQIPTLLNLIAFQMFWLLLVWAALHSLDPLAVVGLGLWLLVHLRYSRHRISDLRLIGLAMLLGPLCDTVLIQFQLADFQGWQPVSGLPPVWIYAMWANFSLLLNHSLSILHGRNWLVILLAVTSAPWAYYGGAWLGAAELHSPLWQPLLTVALCWAVILPLLLRFSAAARA